MKKIPALTDTVIRKAKPGPEPIKLRDGGGLFVLIQRGGTKHWRLDYRRPVTGKRNTLSLGNYPDVGLAAARTRREEAKKLPMHSNQGSQFSSDWQSFLKVSRMLPSMNRRGNCHGNAVVESFFSALKKERIKRRIYPSRPTA